MAQVADDEDQLFGNVYTDLLASEERRNALHGGHRRILIRTPGDGREVKTINGPSPLLKSLRAGKPVELPDFKLPKWARDQVTGQQVRVYPDGAIKDC